jgi:hypothetical protein
MKVTKNIGMLLLAVYLIIYGLLGFGINFGPAIYKFRTGYFSALSCSTGRRHLYSPWQKAGRERVIREK